MLTKVLNMLKQPTTVTIGEMAVSLGCNTQTVVVTLEQLERMGKKCFLISFAKYLAD